MSLFQVTLRDQNRCPVWKESAVSQKRLRQGELQCRRGGGIQCIERAIGRTFVRDERTLKIRARLKGLRVANLRLLGQYIEDGRSGELRRRRRFCPLIGETRC